MMRLISAVLVVISYCSVAVAQERHQQIFALVNSSLDEQNPVISPDGKYIFFTVSNHPKNTGGKADPGDIWYSTIVNGLWTAPVHGGSLLNDRAYNGVAGFSSDGSQLF